jgi:4-amino-4-deoxy-L-arabinose transferase-like glycosyltransferase
VPWAEIGVAIAVMAILLRFVAVDPTTGVTGSDSPFTDEAWNVVNARNLVLLGTWSTDQFNLHLVNGPFSLLEASIFSVFGVGMVQARLLSILSVGLTTFVLAAGLRQAIGRGPALVAATAFASCWLVLYYGRLAYTETLVMLELTAAVLLIGRAEERRGAGRWGLVAGVLFGLALTTKANAAFGVIGAILALLVLEGRGTAAVRRWLAAALLGLAAIAVAWVVIALLPNPSAVATDLDIWAHQVAPKSIVDLARRILAYPFRSDGALPGLIPVGIGGAIGAAATVIGWRGMAPTRRRIAVAAIGWVVLQVGVLFVANYRPNRYLLPALPGVILLLGVGVAAVVDRWREHPVSRGRRMALAGASLAVLILPGVVVFGGWMTRATEHLGPMQAAVAALLPEGSTVWGGYGPLVAMTARVTTIVPWPPAAANDGPDYRSRPVRWVVTGNHEPTWIVRDRSIWAARQKRACFEWDGQPVCLVELPAGRSSGRSGAIGRDVQRASSAAAGAWHHRARA